MHLICQSLILTEVEESVEILYTLGPIRAAQLLIGLNIYRHILILCHSVRLGRPPKMTESFMRDVTIGVQRLTQGCRWGIKTATAAVSFFLNSITCRIIGPPDTAEHERRARSLTGWGTLISALIVQQLQLRLETEL